MKRILIILLFQSCLINCIAQNTITNYKENQTLSFGSLHWLANYGFYGQEFEFSKNVDLYSFSVYVYHVSEHDETKSAINYSIWSFGSIPEKELFLSEPVNIIRSDTNNWKKFQFKTPLKLPKGKYLFSVGQSKIQGFVAFGNGDAKDNYHSKFWVKAPVEGFSDGTNWFDLIKFETSLYTTLTDEQKQKMNQDVVMMRIEYK
jgi:hypothetical protein